MKFLLIAAPLLAAVLAAVLTVLLIGLLLARSHRATRSIRLAAPPERVWSVISDFPTRPSWVPGLTAVERLPDRNGHTVWKDARADGWGLPTEIEVSEPPRRLVTRIADDSLPFGGTWTWEIVPEGDGARLRITEDGEVRTALFRYFGALGDNTSTIRTVLTALAKHTGGDSVVDP